MNLGFQWCKPKLILAFRLFIILSILANLLFASISIFFVERDAKYEYFPDFHFFSAPVCGFGTLLFAVHLLLNRKRKGVAQVTLYHLPIVIILLGTLASGSITYTGEDSPSFWVVLFVTAALLPLSFFFLWKLGKYGLLSCCCLLYSPSLAYYSAHQWVHWNTQLFGDEVAQIEGWNFKPGAWQWFNLEVVEKKDVIVYNWVPCFRRFAIKHPRPDSDGKGHRADILYSVEKIDGKLLITRATHVWWQSSGETGVWPSR